MELRRHHPQRVAAAKTGFSERTGRRIEGDLRSPSQKAAERPLRRQVADPLGGIGCGARWSVASAPGAPSMGPSAK